MLCAYMSENDLERYSKVSDEELNELFQEVRGLFPDRYFLQERKMIKKEGFFKKPETLTVYTLFCQGSNKLECQVFGFPIESLSSTSYTTTKSLVASYFLGLINGRNYEEKV